MLTKKEAKQLKKEIVGTAGGEDSIDVNEVLEILADFTEKEEGTDGENQDISG